jgi:hypothetical protein
MMPLPFVCSPRDGAFPAILLDLALSVRLTLVSDQGSSREQKGIALNSRDREFHSVRPRSVSSAEDGVPPVMLRERLGDLH